jgi:hypothetical protein
MSRMIAEKMESVNASGAGSFDRFPALVYTETLISQNSAQIP